jgi:hypothetical protein
MRSPKQLRSDEGSKAVGADNGIVFFHAAAFEMEMHFIFALLQMLQLAAQANASGWQSAEKDGQEIGSPYADSGDVKLSQGNVHQNLAALCPDEKMSVRTTAGQHLFE